jgi:mono/diheme cytochrome c family protein
MRFLRDAIVTIVLLAFVMWIGAYLRVRAGGLSADAQPGAIERGVAARLVRFSIPADADRQTNPFVGDGNAWRAVVDHYEDHCATCHGRDGRAKTELGENMYPNVPDLSDARIQGLSDGALFHIIQNGVRWTGMPAWKREHSPEETWRLVSLIRKLPSLTPPEIEALEKSAQGEAEKPEHHEHTRPDSYRNPR